MSVSIGNTSVSTTTTNSSSNNNHNTRHGTAALDLNALAEASQSITASASSSAYFTTGASLSYQPQRLNLSNLNVVVASSVNNNAGDDNNSNNNNDDNSTEATVDTIVGNESNRNKNLLLASHTTLSRSVAISSLQETNVKFLKCHQDWKLVSRLGGGGFGEVWLGYRKGDPDQCLRALKIAKTTATKELDHEMELLLLMPSHPHIVQPLGAFTFQGGTQLVMEYCEGGSLAGWLEKHGAMPEEQVREYTRQILLGLAFLNRCSILHRDIKPHNILLDKYGNIKLVDFGLSSTIYKTDETQIAGSARYMSHEAFTNPAQISSATDLWSLGATLCQLLTNKRPWQDRFNKPDQEVGFWQLRSLIISLPLDEKERAGHHPTIPDFVSAECKNFLEQVFNIDPLKRGSAAQLLSHPWMLKALEFKNAAMLEQQQKDAGADFMNLSLKVTVGEHHNNNNNNIVGGGERAATANTTSQGGGGMSSTFNTASFLPYNPTPGNLEDSVSTVFEKTASSHLQNPAKNNNNNDDNGLESSSLSQHNLNNSNRPLSSSQFSINAASFSQSASETLNNQLLESAIRHVEDEPHDARLWSVVARLLPSEETAVIKGQTRSRAQCMLKACQLEPTRILYWNMLGRELNHPQFVFGPNSVTQREKSPTASSEISVSATDAFVKCVEISPKSAVAWRNLGLTLSASQTVTIADKTYNKQQCYLAAVVLDEKQAASWTNLGVTMKTGETVSIGDQNFSKLECFVKALSLDPSSAVSWSNVGNLLRSSESVTIGDQKISKLQCQINATTLFPSSPACWNNLAAAMTSVGSINNKPATVVVAGREVTRLDALSTALAQNPTNSSRWRSLGYNMGKEGVDTIKFDFSARMRTIEVTQKDCYEKAVCLDVDNATRWSELGAVMNDDDIAYIRPIHQQATASNNNANSNNNNNNTSSQQQQGTISNSNAGNESPNHQQHALFSSLPPSDAAVASSVSPSASTNSLPSPSSPITATTTTTTTQDRVFSSGKDCNFPPMNKIQCLTQAASLDSTDASSLYVLSTLLKKEDEKNSNSNNDTIINNHKKLKTVVINGQELTSADLEEKVLELCRKFYRKVDEHCQAQVTDHNRLYTCEKGHIVLTHFSKTWRCDSCRGRDDFSGALSCRQCDMDVCAKCFDSFLKAGSIRIHQSQQSSSEEDVEY